MKKPNYVKTSLGTQRGSMPVLLILLGVVIIGGGVYFYTEYFSKDTVNTNFDLDNKKTNPENTAIKTYTSTNFNLEFEYPSLLTVTENTNEITINHSIPFKNNGCDMKGDGIINDRLADFNVIVRTYNKSLIESVKIEAPYISDEYISGNTLVTPGFIDEYKVGSLSGYSNYMGVEGCGRTIYFFPLSENKTLVLIRNQVQEFSGVVLPEIEKEVLAIPGVITPEKSEIIFRQILSSIKFTK